MTINSRIYNKTQYEVLLNSATIYPNCTWSMHTIFILILKSMILLYPKL